VSLKKVEFANLLELLQKWMDDNELAELLKRTEKWVTDEIAIGYRTVVMTREVEINEMEEESDIIASIARFCGYEWDGRPVEIVMKLKSEMAPEFDTRDDKLILTVGGVEIIIPIEETCDGC